MGAHGIFVAIQLPPMFRISAKGFCVATAKFVDTMIGSKDLPTTAEFYAKFLGMEISDPGVSDSFMILKDPKTQQRLLIVADPSIQNAQPSIESEDMEKTLEVLKSHGGRVLNQNTYPKVKVANVQDPDGRNLCIWQAITA